MLRLKPPQNRTRIGSPRPFMERQMKVLLWSGLAAWIIAIAVHDLYLGFFTDAATYTMDIRRIASRHPMLPLTVGLVFGLLFAHFFWNR